jgi:hypothetical protein
MTRRSGDFWGTAALVAAAVVLPFGFILVPVAAAVRARMARAPRVSNPYDEWWNLKRLATSGPSALPDATSTRPAAGVCTCRPRLNAAPHGPAGAP